jgi:hypothetical protein
MMLYTALEVVIKKGGLGMDTGSELIAVSGSQTTAFIMVGKVKLAKIPEIVYQLGLESNDQSVKH